MSRTIVLVPIHLDALYVKEGRRVIQPAADFTRLPYFDGARDVNASVAWLSEEIVSESFQDERLYLEKGIHLHWGLPEALTRASQRAEAGKSTFPPLPDRWLITRGREINGNSTVEKQWVVESNYLFQDDEPGKIAHPVWTEPDTSSVARRPFRHMGRALPLKQWLERDRDKDEYLHPPLTAVGYGEPSFAAFYPNCHSVFGFYDDQVAAAIPGGLYYQLIGWYDDPHHDYLQIVMREARAKRREGETGNEVKLAKDLMGRVLKEQFRWAVGNNPPADALIVCHARLSFRPTGDPLWTPELEKPIVTFGASVTEALSAYLAEEISQDEATAADAEKKAKIKAEIEDQLEAALLSPQLEHRELDLAVKFMEARHAKGFAAVDSGFLWAVRPRTDAATNNGGDGAAGVVDPPWPDVAERLSNLNRLQHAYNGAWDEIRAMRRQMFSDWYKYMLCLYPPVNAEADYPKISQVRFFIEHQSLPALEKALATAGELIAPPDPSKANLPLTASSTSRDYSLASRIQRVLIDTLAGLASHQASAPKAQYVLQPVAAPRYWQPAEPVILLTGGMAQTDDRRNRGGASSDGGLLPCRLLDIERDAIGKDRDGITLEQLRNGVDSGPHPGARVWTEQPWHPFMLEWEVELTPFKHLSNLATKATDYDSQFVTRNFTLKRSDVDLSPKANEPALAQGAHVYRGSSLLTPHGIDLYVARLKEYLEQARAEEAAGKSDRSPLNADTRQRLEKALTKLKSEQFFCLAQSLSGFNDALLMHKQTLQLPIDDPIGFADQRRFAARVRAAVGDQIFSAPQPFNDFSPIRTGELRMKRMRLVSTFGRLMDFDCDDCRSAEPMPSRRRDGGAILLQPRLVQPARLQFRWLAANHEGQEMSSHPDTTSICGWAMANYLDESLFFYSGQGEALGYLEVEADAKVRWRSAPGRQSPIIQLDQIDNIHLREMISFFLKGSKDYFRQFLTDLENAQMKIEPEHVDEALGLGQPLALVRASLSLELQGPPAIHQGWNEFRLNMTRRRRDCDKFAEVQFPFRLGEQDQLNDGLTVYWLEDGAGGYKDKAYIIPNYDEAVDNPQDKKCDFLYQSIDAPPLNVTMLIDPRGVVHATTGILPVKAIQIPPSQYAAALRKIEMSYLAAPLLVEKRGVEGKREITLPVDDSPGRAWSWLEKHDNDWLSLPINSGSLYTPFAAATEIREGWLKLTRVQSQDDAPQGGERR